MTRVLSLVLISVLLLVANIVPLVSSAPTLESPCHPDHFWVVSGGYCQECLSCSALKRDPETPCYGTRDTQCGNCTKGHYDAYPDSTVPGTTPCAPCDDEPHDGCPVIDGTTSSPEDNNQLRTSDIAIIVLSILLALCIIALVVLLVCTCSIIDLKEESCQACCGLSCPNPWYRKPPEEAEEAEEAETEMSTRTTSNNNNRYGRVPQKDLNEEEKTGTSRNG